MAVLTSPKKLYKRIIPILVNSHLYMLNTDYVNDEWYGNWHGTESWRITITEDYATLQYEHCAARIKWIWKSGKDS